MIKFLLAAVLFVGLSAGLNAQSKDCGTKDKAGVTTVNKHCDVPETVTKDAENSDQIAGALAGENSKMDETNAVTAKNNSDESKDAKGCCSADKKKTDDPKK